MAKPSKSMPRGTGNKPSGKVVTGIAKGAPSSVAQIKPTMKKKGC